MEQSATEVRYIWRHRYIYIYIYRWLREYRVPYTLSYVKSCFVSYLYTYVSVNCRILAHSTLEGAVWQLSRLVPASFKSWQTPPAVNDVCLIRNRYHAIHQVSACCGGHVSETFASMMSESASGTSRLFRVCPLQRLKIRRRKSRSAFGILHIETE